MIFDWFAYIKDELFSDVDDCTRYSQEFFDSNEEYDCILKVADNVQLQQLKDELLETAKIRLRVEGICCPVCFESFSELEEVQIFRDCLHAFCRGCLEEHCTHTIKSGHIDKLRCPTSNE